MKATITVFALLILVQAARGQTPAAATCKPGAHNEKGKCVIDRAPTDPMFQRSDKGWTIFCPMNTEVYRTTPKPACMLGTNVIQAKPTLGELMCRSIGAQPALPACK